jgi:hypothetical protein
MASPRVRGSARTGRPAGKNAINLAGGISITASGGEIRHIGAGEIVLVEDTTGKAHITKSSGERRRALPR